MFKNLGLIVKVKCVAGKIGPPKLDLSRHADKIIVDIYHPVFPSMEFQPWITDNLDFTYKVTFWDNETQVCFKIKT